MFFVWKCRKPRMGNGWGIEGKVNIHIVYYIYGKSHCSCLLEQPPFPQISIIIYSSLINKTTNETRFQFENTHTKKNQTHSCIAPYSYQCLCCNQIAAIFKEEGTCVRGQEDLLQTRLSQFCQYKKEHSFYLFQIPVLAFFLPPTSQISSLNYSLLPLAHVTSQSKGWLLQ